MHCLRFSGFMNFISNSSDLIKRSLSSQCCPSSSGSSLRRSRSLTWSGSQSITRLPFTTLLTKPPSYRRVHYLLLPFQSHLMLFLEPKDKSRTKFSLNFCSRHPSTSFHPSRFQHPTPSSMNKPPLPRQDHIYKQRPSVPVQASSDDAPLINKQEWPAPAYLVVRLS